MVVGLRIESDAKPSHAHKMFCPRCGDEMLEREGVLACVRGNMPLARDVRKGLQAAFEQRTRSTRPDLADAQCRWLCPGCGAFMSRVEGRVVCPECGGCLDAFIYPLTDFHPHLRRVLTVDDVFDIKGRGLVLAPPIDASEARPGRVEMVLRLPDGTETRANALVQIPFTVPTPNVLQASVLLLELPRSAVPIGTEVWSFT